MARAPRRKPDAGWLENIATRAGVDVKTAQAVLDRHHVKASPANSRPRRLTLKRIAFRGEKHGEVTEGAFAFEWNDLDQGMYAVLSDGNLKGKSSIFHIVRWLLRGEETSGLQADVRSWIHAASLRFLLDELHYEVSVDATDGVKGVLVRLDGEEQIEIARYSDGPEFKAVMASFFMSELALEPIASWRDDVGEAVTHEWTALSGVLAIGPKFESLLGEIAMAGLPTRLLQMYLGLPWVPTLCAAKVAKSAIDREGAERKRRRQERAVAQMSRVEALEGEVGSLRARLNALPDVGASRERYYSLERRLIDASNRRRSLSLRRGELIDTEKKLEAASLEDRKRLQEVIDAEAAGKIFRVLDPKCCPRCEAAITDERRKRELAASACAVCGESVQADEDIGEERERAKSQAAMSKKALDAHQRLIVEQDESVAEAAQQIRSLEDERIELETAIRSASARSELELAVLRCEARLEEAKRPADDDQEDGDGDAATIVAAVTETEFRVKEIQDSLLKEVSQSIKDYAVRFGMAQLTEATLGGNATLKLVKGGQSTSFSRVTAGEQLRLKIATVLAILKLGEKRKLGRHPGLLLVDSPGAEELAEDNLEDLIGELKAVAGELGHLQIFVAARASEPVLTHIDSQRLRRAEGDNWVW